MAANRYSAVIDIGVVGSRKVDEVLKKTEDIRDVLKSISKTSIAIDDRRASDVFKQLAKNVNDFARGVANGQKQLANTELGLQRQANALSKVSAQAKIGEALYKNAIEGQVKAEQKLRIAQLQRLDVERKLFQRGKGAFNESFKGVPELLKLGPKIANTTASLELYRNELARTLSIVDIGSNDFRALEEAITSVDRRISNSFLSGQTSKITPAAGPATDLGSLKAFKEREKFEKSIEKQLIRQLAVEQRINQANLDDVQKAKLRNDLAEATNQLAANELTISQQITSEVERQRISLERAARTREKREGGVRRTGQFSPLTAPKRLQNIQASAVLLQEKLNTLAAKGVDVSTAKSRVERLLLNTKDDSLALDLKTLNLLDDELNGLRQIVKLENQILTTKNAQNKADKKSKKDRDKQAKDKQKGKKAFTQTKLGQAALGAAFPALFGGGVGGVVGGALGEFALGPLGGVIGSAIGGALENAAGQVAEFGNALRKPTENLEALAKAAGLAGTAQNRSIAISQFLGVEEIGGTIAAAEVEKLIGAESVQALKDLSAESDRLGNNFNKLGTRLQSAFAPLLNQLARFGTFITGGSPEDPQQRLQTVQASIQAISSGSRQRGSAAALNRLLEEEKELQGFIKSRSQSEEDITSIIEGRQQLLRDATDFEKDRLNLTRVSLAARQSGLEVNRIQNALNEIELKLNQNITDAKRDQLEIDQAKLQEQKAAAEAARQNAIREAEIAVLRERAALGQQFRNLELDIFKTQLDFVELTNSDVATYGLKIKLAENELQVRKEVLVSQAKSRLLTVNEPEVRAEIIRNLAQEVLLLQDKLKLSQEQTRQNETLRRDAVQAVKDQRELKNLQTRGQAGLQIAQADPNRQLESLVSGFVGFADSAALQIKQTEELTLQTALYEEQLQRLQDRLELLKTTDPDGPRRESVQDQIKDLTDTLSLYKELQPQINEAALAQQRFNDAFAFTLPLVNSLGTGLTEVVKGTKSAEEAFADFLDTVAKMLMQTAAQLIATYIAIGIARAFAGLGTNVGEQASLSGVKLGSGGGTFTNIAGNEFSTLGPNFGFRTRADGGPVANNVPYLVGEEGPELFVPFQNGTIVPNGQTQQMMNGASQSGGNSSTVNNSFQQMQVTNVPFTRSAEQASVIAAEQETAKAIRNPGPIDVRYESQVINGVEYVTAEQHQKGMAQAADRGRALTLASLQNSVKARRRIGL